MTTDAIVRWILEHFEGDAYTDDPLDSGGATRWGITLRTWQYFVTHVRGEPRTVTKGEMKRLALEDAVQCILAMHVGEGRLDRIPDWRLQFVVIDWAIHSWYVAPLKALQSSIAGLVVDGALGSKTAAALAGEDPMRLTTAIVGLRIGWLDGLIRRRPKDERFRKGWMRRVGEGARFVSLPAAD